MCIREATSRLLESTRERTRGIPVRQLGLCSAAELWWGGSFVSALEIHNGSSAPTTGVRQMLRAMNSTFDGDHRSAPAP